MELPILGLWYVCALGAVVFAAYLPLRPVPVAAAAGAFAAVAWWVAPAGVVDVATAALLAAVVAGWNLTRRVPPVVPALMAGGLAGAWTGVLGFQGLPFWAAVAIAALVLVGSALLAWRRPAFAPATLRDESLLFVCALGLLAAALPSVIEGWSAAGTLGLQAAASETPQIIPVWSLLLTGSAAALGGLYAVWSRR